MACNSGPDIIEDGLVLCLDAANINSYPKSGATWSDLAGSNNGTLINDPIFDSANGGSIHFDGANEYVNLGSPSNIFSGIFGSNKISIGGWFKVSEPSPSYQRIVFDSGTSEVVQIDMASGGIALYLGGPNTRISRVEPTADEWFHFLGTYNGSSMIGYFNGSKYTESSGLSSNISSSDNGSTMIAKYPGGGYQFYGRVSNFSIYNRALTADEIRRNYEATVGRYT
jgi:hypothetical protein